MKLKKEITKRQWVNFSIVTSLYLLFILWMQNAWLLLGVIWLIDVYLTKFIDWGAWKRSKNPKVREMLSWIDDILFALIAVYLINLFAFQNYQIPSSSLEKSLLVGDYLFVSKLSYGPRVPNTPIAFPLVQNTFPLIGTKSYLEWPRWDYKRVKGTGHIERNDIVVFNFPAGDTIALHKQNPDFYMLLKTDGRERIMANRNDEYGEVMYRPVDKRENYVKRCIGMPGDSIEIRHNQVFVNGTEAKNPENMQLNYFVETNGSMLTEDQFRLLGVTRDDRLPSHGFGLVSGGGADGSLHQYLGFTANDNAQYNPIYKMPLTDRSLAIAKKLPNVRSIVVEPDAFGGDLYYPLNYDTKWTRGNYGPIWIPRKGDVIELTPLNIALYERCIKNYENNSFEVKEGVVYINGKAETTYTFKYDYYWMMGDNRHNSADSRSWGFVPEDHIVGRPVFVWLSLDKDRGLFDGGIRWNRMFRKVSLD